MRKYSKPQIVAKNLPTGSYAAGCPVNYNANEGRSTIWCHRCERTK